MATFLLEKLSVKLAASVPTNVPLLMVGTGRGVRRAIITFVSVTAVTVIGRAVMLKVAPTKLSV